MKIYMANHIVKNISLLTLLLIFQIILRRAGTLTKKNQVIIIICSAIPLMVMLVLGLVSYVRRKKLRKEGNLYDMDSYNFLCMIIDFQPGNLNLISLILAIQLSKLFLLNDSLTVSRMNIRCQNESNNEGWNEDMELLIFDLITIYNATDNFAINNKLGEGGFGSVYKVNNNLTS